MNDPEWLRAAFKIVAFSFIQFISLIGGLVIGGLLLGYLERQANRRMIHAFGLKSIYWTAWLGTPVHELSHVLIGLMFHHRVTEVKLLQAVDADGTMGYVRHAYQPSSLYQRIGNFFIGVAPLIGGSLLIACIAAWLVPTGSVLHLERSHMLRLFSFFDLPTWVGLGQAVAENFRNLFSAANFSRPSYWLFLYAALCIASRMSLSTEDIRGAGSGAGALFCLLVVANGLSVLLDPALHTQIMYWIGRFNFLLMVMLSLSIFFSLLVLLISCLLFQVKRYLGH
ncbi:hypothetical protein [Sporolactobacillus terrae]|uniref:Membrane protein n=1 Tax=Sporolactobacillus terrae TaxID=269673 RepID=A0A410DC25_9BACL|nr:hypothetical protein [Sporolactobacillus terrae]QAA23619.1 hypothetical protein C0674_14045 [Sporolactobacillus terrae]QAA26589.1 hypothetical protein C0679_14030 [Sporolactobacillus terrae]UAK15660.1 hypothetical protein K7399_11585 [Sporolactobacillus terrae]BBO00127.1 membrane protein [Sporolactobacillus terrae]